MIVILKSTYVADIAEIPDYLMPDLKKYYIKFSKWLFDKDNNHDYWVYKDGKRLGVSYGCEAFVIWLNKYVLNESNAKAEIIKQSVHEYDKNLPILYF